MAEHVSIHVRHDKETDRWTVCGDDNEILGSYATKDEAIAQADRVAREHRPSRVFLHGEEDGRRIPQRSSYNDLPTL